MVRTFHAIVWAFLEVPSRGLYRNLCTNVPDRDGKKHGYGLFTSSDNSWGAWYSVGHMTLQEAPWDTSRISQSPQVSEVLHVSV